MRKNYILATAGHVDHGKTSIIRSLTGFDCDTHPEEKKRGITIHLGFTHIELADDVQAGIIDVPGHQDFIDNMISGINGIDLVIFIIAADESFMPQTFEHLNICQMLGVRRGIIILTKSDLVDEEMLEYAKLEIKENVENTFLYDAPILTTSAITGLNIDLIKPTILEQLQLPDRDYDKQNSIQHLPFFRLYPDRFFQIAGFGSVLTGTVLSGKLSRNQPLYGIPGESEFRIRRMEAYGHEVDCIEQGQRASLNLTNFEKGDFRKGLMLCDKPYPTTSLIDVELKLFTGVRQLDIWSNVEFYISTIQTQGRIHLMNVDRLFPGEQCFAQIHLDKAIPVCFGDKFIIRNTSGVQTLGGGVVIDAFPLHHRRRTEKVKKLLNQRVSGCFMDLLCTELEKSIKPISLIQIYNKLRLATVENIDWEKLPDIYTRYEDWFWLLKEQVKLEKRIARYLQVAHKHNPMDPHGKPIDDFYSLLVDFPEGCRSIVMRAILNNLCQIGTLEARQNTFALSTHKVVLTERDHVQINWVEQFLLNQNMKTPLWSEMLYRGSKHDIDETKLKRILFFLVGRKRVYHFNGEYIHTQIIDPIRMKFLHFLHKKPEGCTVAEFRDLIGGNRKICVILLNIFDDEGIIIRSDDMRYISEKGKRAICQ
jgi:selenocysteine-specific elongation factor